MANKKIAKQDIIKVNAYGQRVVVVAKGHPIPDDVPEPSVPVTQAPAVEDKAVKSSRQRKRK